MAEDYSYLLKDLKHAEERAKPRINPEQKLSLCMIARNEEAFIGDALASAQSVVDEIIVVDTGSTDRTVEIAKSYGARVFFKEWENDFAKARNESLRHATGDWVLIMDADERIPDGFEENLRSLLVPIEQPLSYLLYIKNYMQEEDEGSVLGHYMVRLFRKTAETRFFGVIHEQLYPNWGEVTIPENTFYFTHLGYAKVEKKEAKIENRNIPLLKKALEETEGKNPSLYSFYAFYMGTSIVDTEEVKMWLQKSIEACPDPSRAAHIPVAYLDYMRAFYYSRDYAEGIEVARKGLDTVTALKDYPDFWDSFGTLLLANENYDESIEAFEKALELVSSDSDQGVFFAARTSRIGSWGTLMNLGLAYALQKEQAKAQEYFTKALDIYPGDKDVLTARIDRIMGNRDLTQSYFEERVKAREDSSDADKLVLSNIYLRQEEPFEALVLQSEMHGIEKMLSSGMELARTYEQYQRFDLARKIYEGVLSLEPEHMPSQIGLAGLELQAKEASLEISKIDELAEKCKTEDDWFALGQLAHRFQQFEKAEEAYQKQREIAEDDYNARLYIALIKQDQQDFEAALKILQELIQQAPERPEALTQLGNMLLFLGQFPEAEQMFHQVIQLEQADWYTHYAFGIALSGQEKFDDAVASIEKARRIAPRQPAPKQMLELIEQERQKQQSNS